MFANTKTLAVIAAAVLAAQAQTTTGTAPASQSSVPAGLDNCILGCVTTAATSAGCASFSDLPCVCTSMTFQNAALACLQANCTAQDLATATQLQGQECAAFASGMPSGTAMPSGMTMTSGMPMPSGMTMPSGSGGASPATGSSAAPAATTSVRNAAMTTVSYSFQTLFGALVASAGVLIGGTLVL